MRGRADLIIRGGPVWTGLPGAPIAEAVAVSGGLIRAVGSSAELEPLMRRGTRVIELEGRLALPGFVDAHVHFMIGGLTAEALDLRDAHTTADFVARVAGAARALPHGAWVTGGNWDHERWGGELPHRDWLDHVAPWNPVWLTRTDLHMAVANSAALVTAGVTADTDDPLGGVIERDEHGVPTGILRDSAMALLQRAVPDPAPDTEDRALATACRIALSRGVTQVHDMARWTDFAVYRRARAARRLPVRIYAVLPMPGWARVRDLIEFEGHGDARLWWGGVKAFVDGSLGSGTAWFHEPYTDVPESCGLTLQEPEVLREWILKSDAAGLQTVVHAIGDRAVEWLLDAFREAARVNGPRDRRARVEHAQHLRPHLLPRFREDGVIASVQPFHAVDDGRWIRNRIGEERLAMAYPLASLHAHGAPLAYGSDWTVAPLDPLAALRAAVTRKDPDGSPAEGWALAERVDPQDALAAQTLGSARAGFAEDRTGTLEQGKSADITILSDDLLRLDPEEWEGVEVDHTVVEGEVLFTRGG